MPNPESSPDLIALRHAPLDPGEAIAHVTCPDAGGIDVFIGTTRTEQNAARGPLVALDYACYEPMAVSELTKLIQNARARWPIARTAILHRIGRCAVGEASVVIAVSCPHRAEAFDACRFLIDELKKTVPIWKKDLFAAGERWHHDRPSA